MSPSSARLDATIALHRFGLGVRPGDIERIAADPRGALLAEVKDQTGLSLPGPGLPNSNENAFNHQEFKAKRREIRERAAEEAKARKEAGGMEAMGEMEPPKAPNIAGELYRTEWARRIEKAALAEIGFAERLAHFWANHFAVIAKGKVRGIAGSYEREAIRPHVLGRFEDMLLAVARHPAMLMFLDNRRSVGPNSAAADRRKGRGLNENFARELFELHTIGVDAGYAQSDVTELALVLTGWSLDWKGADPDDAGLFEFFPKRHEPGRRTVLGTTYPAGGVEQGEAVLRDLARHPATARRLSRKLAAHLLADEPPDDLVAELTRVWQDTSGDLGEVARAAVRSDAAWRREPGKVRSPQDMLFAALRATGWTPDPVFSLQALVDLGQPPWQPGAPTGFNDTAQTWLAPDAITHRLEVTLTFARNAAGDMAPVERADAVLGPFLKDETRTAIARAESDEQALALMMMSPEFQRR